MHSIALDSWYTKWYLGNRLDHKEMMDSATNIYEAYDSKWPHSLSLRQRNTRIAVNQAYAGFETTQSGVECDKIKTLHVNLDVNRLKLPRHQRDGHT